MHTSETAYQMSINAATCAVNASEHNARTELLATSSSNACITHASVLCNVHISLLILSGTLAVMAQRANMLAELQCGPGWLA